MSICSGRGVSQPSYVPSRGLKPLVHRYAVRVLIGPIGASDHGQVALPVETHVESLLAYADAD
jgi:hypothetical protein